MDPASWSIKEWFEVLGGPGAALVLLILNLRGTLWWKPQVDKLLGTIVEAATEKDAIRVEQIEAERTDKNAQKALCDKLAETVGALTRALEEEKRKNRVGP